MRKSRPDAVLKMLPAEEQEELFEYLQKHSCPEAVAWLAERGTQTQRYSVRLFFHWYAVSRQVGGAVVALRELSELTAEHPELVTASEPAAKVAQALLELQAMQAGDVRQHVALARIRQGAQRVEYERRRLRQKDDALRLKVAQFRHQRRQARERSARQEGAEQRAERRFQRENISVTERWIREEKSGKGQESDDTFAKKYEALGHAVYGDVWAEMKLRQEALAAAARKVVEEETGRKADAEARPAKAAGE